MKPKQNEFISIFQADDTYLERRVEDGPQWDVSGVSRSGVLLVVYDHIGFALYDRKVTWDQFETDYVSSYDARYEQRESEREFNDACKAARKVGAK